MKYTQESKNIVRQESLSYAIKSLTRQRKKSTIASRSYVREIKEQIAQNDSGVNGTIASNLSEEEILKWEGFYDAIVKNKKAKDLRVAYLSGPNPLNDLNVLIENGILPENVWAFESDKNTYDEAIFNTINSNFPFIKIYKGKIDNYLSLLPFQFDIIYLDFCGKISSKSTLSVVRKIFQFQKLSSPGALVTNFALPQGPKNELDAIAKICSNYLFSRSFTEKLTAYGGGMMDSAMACSYTPEIFLKKAKRNLPTFYSQFITRILYDLPLLILPHQRIANSQSISKLFFERFNINELPIDYDEDMGTFPEENSIPWALEGGVFNDDPIFTKKLNSINSQLSIKNDAKQLVENLNLMNFFMREGIEDRYSSKAMRLMNNAWKPFEKLLFCDVFLFHQVKEILIGQVTSPYVYNVNKTKRWTYVAKENRMFVDCIIYDQCRYIYDWMPTLDMIENGINNIDRQLTLRFALDALAKNTMWYNNQFFFGTSVVSAFEDKFDAKELKKRIKVN